MTRKWIFVAPISALAACVVAILCSGAYGQQGTTILARSQLRRVVDPSPRAASGTVLMSIDANGKETFQVNVRSLGEANYAPVFRDEPSNTTNITFVLDLAPLNRTNIKRGNWTRTLVGLNHAPDDFLPFFGHLTELTNTEIDVAQPGIPLVTTIFTNIIAGVTNISMGVTNIIGNTTNIINGIVIPNPGQTGTFFSVLWAPLKGLSAQPSTESYRRRGNLVAVGDASPKATGTVNIRFDGNTGRSSLKIRAAHLTPGQEYTLFVANSTNQDTTVMLPVDKMTQKKLGPTATFVRDTRFADPLPQQARDIGDLSGQIIQIRDAFDVVHLQGLMP